MAWVAVDKIGEELISRTEPFRVGGYWIGYSIFHLPNGSIRNSSEENLLLRMSQYNLNNCSLCIDRLQCIRLFVIDVV